jgi:hypothetical protein
MESMTLVFLRQGTNNKIKRRRKTKKLQIQRISKNKPNKIRLSKNKPNKIRLSKNKPNKIWLSKNKPNKIWLSKNKPNKIWLSKSKNRFNSGKRGKKKEQNLDKHKSINPFTARPNNNL